MNDFIEKSNHKNYIENHGRNRDLIIETYILPHQKDIFNFFHVKFQNDAEQDLKRGRKLLFKLGKNCSDDFNKIHSILKSYKTNNDYDYDEIFNLVQNIVNMDYESILKFFNTLKTKYLHNPQIYDLLDDICKNISKMWDISKDKTNIVTN